MSVKCIVAFAVVIVDEKICKQEGTAVFIFFFMQSNSYKSKKFVTVNERWPFEEPFKCAINR